MCKDAYAVADGADALVLMTEWNQFRNLDLGRIRNALRQPVFVDGRNVYDPARMLSLGFIYEGMGRLPKKSAQLALSSYGISRTNQRFLLLSRHRRGVASSGASRARSAFPEPKEFL